MGDPDSNRGGCPASWPSFSIRKYCSLIGGTDWATVSHQANSTLERVMDASARSSKVQETLGPKIYNQEICDSSYEQR